MSNDLAIQVGGPLNLPTHLQGMGLGVGQSLMAAIGDSRNRIGVKGNRFRQVINGQEVGVWDENYLDVIILGVVPTLSRLFYAGKFKQTGDNAPPTCYSVDNVTPADDVQNKQSILCNTCPQNIKGSRVSDDGHQGKACGYFRRIAIILPGDDTLYYIDVKSMGLFGESHKQLNKFSMNDYAKYLNTAGVDASVVITRLSFDTNHSVPKVLFQPLRFLDVEEGAVVRQLAATEPNPIQEYLTINMKTVDISSEASSDVEDEEEEEEVEQAEAPQMQAQPAQQAPKPVAQQAPKPVAQQAPKPAPKPTPVQATPAPKPVQQAPKPVATKGPGKLVQAATPRKVERVVVDNNVPAPTKTVQSTPAPKASPVEITDDEEMADLLSELDL